MSKDREQEIERARRAEEKRGRKRPHLPLATKRTQVQVLIEQGTVEEFELALISRGWRRGSLEFDEAVSAFRSEQQRARSPS